MRKQYLSLGYQEGVARLVRQLEKGDFDRDAFASDPAEGVRSWLQGFFDDRGGAMPDIWAEGSTVYLRTRACKQCLTVEAELPEPVFQELSEVTLLFAFRGWSDADVAAFVERCESEPLQWYYVTLSTVFFDILEEISNDLGSAFVAALESQPDA